MAESDKYFSRSYVFILKINGKDYSEELNYVRIVSNLQNCWPVFSLQLFISSSDILLEGLHGQDDIELTLRLSNYDEEITENLVFNLMILQPSSNLSIESQMIGEKQKDRSKLSLMLVPKLPYKSMTKVTNGVFINKKIKGTISDLVGRSPGLKMKFDSNGENTELIDQICIHPTTLYKSILQVDSNFGIYDGCPAVYCYYDHELQIINLSDRIKKAANIIITHLASGKDNTEIIKKCKDGINFCTYTKIKSETKTNQEFVKLGKNINYIVKPKDKLFHTIKIDLESICKEYGAISGNDKIHVSQTADRTKYESSECGNNMSETFVRSTIAKKVFGLNSITVDLEKSLIIEKLLQVGQAVKFKTETVEYIELSGQYILQMSDLKWDRNGKQWENICKMKLVRTNKLK